jgi:hypothetical protein
MLQLLSDLFSPFPSSPMRALIGLVVSVVMLVIAAYSLADASVLWQVGLQSLAASGLVFGTVLIYVALRHDWHVLLGSTGILSVSSLALGVGAAALMRYGQRLQKHRRREA